LTGDQVEIIPQGSNAEPFPKGSLLLLKRLGRRPGAGLLQALVDLAIDLPKPGLEGADLLRKLRHDDGIPGGDRNALEGEGPPYPSRRPLYGGNPEGGRLGDQEHVAGQGESLHVSPAGQFPGGPERKLVRGRRILGVAPVASVPDGGRLRKDDP